jgi:hypothetical protein
MNTGLKQCLKVSESVSYLTLVRRAAVCTATVSWLCTTAWGGKQDDRRLHDDSASYPVTLTEERSIDGSGSSGDSPWGATYIQLLRVAPAAYPGDGSGSEIITAPERANPRTISNVIADQAGLSIPNDRGLSDWVWAFGQFVDHDIDLTGAGEMFGTADIEIEDADDPLGPGPIPFDRSLFDPSTGTSEVPRQQLNEITAFIDASNVYGSDGPRATALRALTGGRLKTGEGDLLPLNLDGLPNAGGPFSTLFVAGDVRANENVVLTSLHTLFLREHNRLVRLVALLAPQATDDEIYHLARKIITAEIQLITYNEFLPALLGPAAPSLLEGQYDPSVNPSISNEFSTAAYRMGHSLLSPNLLLSEQGVASGQLPLQHAFFNPAFLQGDPANVDRLLEGLARQKCQEVDTFVVDDVRNFLFGEPGAGGLDLAMLNIQRGRDHGLPDFNTMRAAYGLGNLNDLAELSSDPFVQLSLRVLYETAEAPAIDNIDPWVGALAEDHLAGASVGPTMAVVLQDQFARLLAGDRFSVLSDPDLDQSLIRSIISLSDLTLADVVRANTSVEMIPDNAFFVTPGLEYDVSAGWDAAANRLFVVGNRGDNHVLIAETSYGCLVQGRNGSRVNGRRGVLFDAGPNRSVTVDLGAGDNSLTVVQCDLEEIVIACGAGDDELRIARSSAGRVFCDLGGGSNRVHRNSGFRRN